MNLERRLERLEQRLSAKPAAATDAALSAEERSRRLAAIMTHYLEAGWVALAADAFELQPACPDAKRATVTKLLNIVNPAWRRMKQQRERGA